MVSPDLLLGPLVLLVRRRAQKKVTDVGGTTPITRNHHPSMGTTPANGLSRGTTPAPSLPTSVTLSSSFSIAEASEANGKAEAVSGSRSVAIHASTSQPVPLGLLQVEHSPLELSPMARRDVEQVVLRRRAEVSRGRRGRPSQRCLDPVGDD